MATDLVTKSEQVFKSGPLSVALRATMSLPGIFSPVRHEGHIYVDGGLLNNLPVTVAKEMGAEFILGIHLETAPLNPDTSLSSFAVLNESISAVIAANEREAMKSADLVVTVPMQKFTSTDYDKADLIIKAGYDAAAASADKLSTLSVDAASWETYLLERDRRRGHTATPQFVEVTGVDSQIAHPIAQQMNDLAEQPVDPVKLDQEILELNGTGPFSSVNYSMVKHEGKQGLQLEAQKKPIHRRSFGPSL